MRSRDKLSLSINWNIQTFTFIIIDQIEIVSFLEIENWNTADF